MVQAVAFLDGRGDVEATVDFDDSIIEDVNTLIDRNIKLVQAGLRSRLTAIKDITKCSDAEAKAELELLAGDNQITGQDTDWTDGDQDDAPEEDANEPDNEPEERG